MVIHHICIRCRHESGEVRLEGCDPMTNSLFFGLNRLALCIRCGGWVYAVQEDQELPDEFLPLAKRLLWAGIASSYKTVFMWWGFAMLFTIPSGYPPALRWTSSWILILLAIAAVIGFALPWAIGWVAKNRMVNLPYPQGMASPGEFQSMAPLFIPTILVTVGIFFFVIKAVAPPDTIRGGGARVVAGFVVAILSVSLAARDTFRIGRKRLDVDSRLRFGSSPK